MKTCMSKTLPEQVQELRAEIEQCELLPTRAAELQNRLAALLSSANEALTTADLTYKHVLLACLKSQDKANRARIEAETTPAYQQFREAKDTRDTCVELVRSLRAYLRNAADEMRLTR